MDDHPGNRWLRVRMSWMLMEQVFAVMVIDDLVGLIVSVCSRSRLCTLPLDWSQDAWSVAPFVLSDAHVKRKQCGA